MSDAARRRPARAPAGSDAGLAVRFCSGEVFGWARVSALHRGSQGDPCDPPPMTTPLIRVL
jgi:hypothetical protein